MKVAILVSGRGSNMQALIEAAADPAFPARICGVVSNVEGAPALARAADANVETAVVPHRAYPGKAAFESALADRLKTMGAEIICLAGFMRLLSADFVARWENRILNIHPSLLPAFKGLDVHRRAIEAGVKLSGCTVHLVTPDMDGGPILVQSAVPVHDGDTPERLAARILETEHEAYPLALRLVAEGRVQVTGGTARVDADPATGRLIHPRP